MPPKNVTLGWLDLHMEAESALLPQHRTGTRCSDLNCATASISTSVTEAGTTSTDG